MKRALLKKAESLLELHHDNKLLVLPNIWDVLGAKLLESMGFQAVATASASVAFSNGYNDGQEIGFDQLLHILKPISAATHLPVSADIERGYANDLNELGDNIEKLIECEIVGVNIEDSINESGELNSIEDQCEIIKTIRKTAEKAGIPIVINARTDIFLSDDFDGNKIEEAILRGGEYIAAGANCFYPILCNMHQLKEIRQQLKVPINVFATKDTLPMKDLEDLGIARLSLGPSLLKSALTKMREVARSLQNYGNYDLFTENVLSSDEIVRILKYDAK